MEVPSLNDLAVDGTLNTTNKYLRGGGGTHVSSRARFKKGSDVAKS